MFLRTTLVFQTSRYIQALLIPCIQHQSECGTLSKVANTFRVSLPCDPSVRTPRYRLAAWEAAMKDNWRNAIRAIVNEVIAAKASEREALPAFLEEQGGGFLLITPSLSPRASKQKRGGARP